MVLFLSIDKLNNMNVNFTGPEKVLYKASYEFAVNVLKVSEQEARDIAMNKILNTRALSRKVSK